MADQAVVLYKGLKANLPAQATAGSLYFTTDERVIRLGATDGTFIKYTDFDIVATQTDLGTPVGKDPDRLYFVKETGNLVYSDGTNWQIANSNVIETIIGTPEDTSDEDTIYGLRKAIQEQLNDVQAGNGVAVADVTETTNKTVKKVSVSLSENTDNILSFDESGKLLATVDSVAQYTISNVAGEGSPYSAVYQLQKDGVGVGDAINIPKDMVVSSGTVETYTEETLPEGVTTPGTYVVLVIANSTSDKLYIPVDKLVNRVVSASQETDAVQIAVNANQGISATIKDGSITSSMLSQEVKNEIATTKLTWKEFTADTVEQ